MPIQLSDHFTYPRLLRFTFPSILGMIFTSIYGVVDGFFVSNYVGATPFASLNLVMPFFMVLGAGGFMLGTGGSALVAVTLGAGNRKHANGIFSLIVAALIVLGLALAALGLWFARPAALFLGATEEMLPYCVLYTRVCMLGLVPFLLQNAFQSFLIAAEKPQLGLQITVAAGLTNMVLDALFMGVFGWGLGSAAAASVIGQLVGGGIPLFYFLFPNKSLLRLGRPRFEGRVLWKAVTNGSSEFLSNISMSVVSMLYNSQLMRFAGQNGVAAFGIIMYTNFIFLGVFFGYSMGAAPILGYHHGAADHGELQNVFRKSLVLIGSASLLLTLLSEALARPLAGLFAGYDPALFALTVHAIRIFAVSYLMMGFNFFGSAFFTALGNGFVSALLSTLRTLVFQVGAVLLFPFLWALPGIWASVVAAEAASLAVTVFCLARYRSRYRYL